MNPLEAPWRSAGRTQRGQARLRNEDAFLDNPRAGCWAVADGMGGYRHGDVASQWVVSQLASVSADGNLDQRIQAVRHRLQDVNQGVRRAWTEPGASGDVTMGSTVVALLLEKGRAACLWAGDSRCYLWRDPEPLSVVQGPLAAAAPYGRASVECGASPGLPGCQGLDPGRWRAFAFAP